MGGWGLKVPAMPPIHLILTRALKSNGLNIINICVYMFLICNIGV